MASNMIAKPYALEKTRGAPSTERMMPVCRMTQISVDSLGDKLLIVGDPQSIREVLTDGSKGSNSDHYSADEEHDADHIQRVNS
jgi:hypothetical protein